MRTKPQELPVSVGWYEKGKKVDWTGRFTRKKKKFIINAISQSGWHCRVLFDEGLHSVDKRLAEQAELALEYDYQCARAVLYLERLWRLRPRGEIDYELGKLDYYESREKRDGKGFSSDQFPAD